LEVELTVVSMTDLVTPARIMPQLRAAHRDELLRKLASAMAVDTGICEDRLLAALARTADIPPLMLRGGISLLHAVADDLQRPVAVVARLQNPLNLGGAEHCDTDILAALVSPAARTSDHLRALACLARRLRRPDVIAHIRATKCREIIYLALTSDEWCALQSESRWPANDRSRCSI
jgi:PTS system nitrogen regulatory IIA component